MSLVRWDPFRDFDDMKRLLGLYTHSHEGNESLTRSEWTPTVDISETPEAYTVQAELPSVKKEDIKLSVEDGVLTLTGERKFEREEKNKKFHRVERSYGRFQRSFTLPTAVDESKVVASYDNGVLNVMLPKTAPQPKAKDIKIT